MKRTKRGLVIAMAFMITVSSGSMFVQANNHGDTRYAVRYSGDGGDVSTPSRAKTDATSAYIKHGGDVNAWVSVRVGNGINQSANGGYYAANMGVGTYLPNYVNENGYSSCYLSLSPATHSPIDIYGVWSPDSI